MKMLPEILTEVVSLPFDKIYTIEEVIKSIRKDVIRKSLETATDLLSDDYFTDKELTSFTNIDLLYFMHTIQVRM